jgi:general secretion pathway protein I
MRNRLKSARGLSLLELVVAIAILAIGTISVIRATGQARHALEGSVPRILAQVVAENRAEALMLPGTGGLPGYQKIGDYGFRVDLDTKATRSGLLEGRITVTSDSGPGVVLVTILSQGAQR